MGSFEHAFFTYACFWRFSVSLLLLLCMVQLDLLPEMFNQTKNLDWSKGLRLWINHQFQIFVKSYLASRVSALNLAVLFRSQCLQERSLIMADLFRRETLLQLPPLLSLRKSVHLHPHPHPHQCHLHRNNPSKRWDNWAFFVVCSYMILSRSIITVLFILM